jgi:hypothetical protein
MKLEGNVIGEVSNLRWEKWEKSGEKLSYELLRFFLA